MLNIWLLANGSAILDVEKNEYLYESELSSEIVDKVLKIIKKYDESACFFGKNGYYMVTSNQKVKDFLTDFLSIQIDYMKMQKYLMTSSKLKSILDLKTRTKLSQTFTVSMF
nr:HAD hydrolase family protein [Mycoplasmopsis bovis]